MTDDQRQYLEMQLSAYLDDELDIEQRREVELLLARDEQARVLLDELRATIEAVRSLPRIRAGSGLLESLRGRMERESLLRVGPAEVVARSAGVRFLRWMGAAAVLALAVTTGYLIWPTTQDRPTLPGERYAARDDATASPDHLETALTDAGAPAMAGKPLQGTGKAAPPVVETYGEGLARPPLGPMAGGQVIQGQGPSAPVPGWQAKGAPAGSLPLHAALAGRPAAGTTVGATAAPGNEVAILKGSAVIELAFADAGRQQEAGARLRQRYAFQPVSSTGGGEPDRTVVLALAVADEHEARRVLSELRDSLPAADSIRVLEEAAPHAEVPRAGSFGLPWRGGETRMRRQEFQSEPPPHATEATETDRTAAARIMGIEQTKVEIPPPPAPAGPPAAVPPPPDAQAMQADAARERGRQDADLAAQEAARAHGPIGPQDSRPASMPPAARPSDRPPESMPVTASRALPPAAAEHATRPAPEAERLDRSPEALGDQTRGAAGFGGFRGGLASAPARSAPAERDLGGMFRQDRSRVPESAPADAPATLPAPRHVLRLYLYVTPPASAPAADTQPPSGP